MKGIVQLETGSASMVLGAWAFLLPFGFVNSLADASLFILHYGNTLIYTLF